MPRAVAMSREMTAANLPAVPAKAVLVPVVRGLATQVPVIPAMPVALDRALAETQVVAIKPQVARLRWLEPQNLIGGGNAPVVVRPSIRPRGPQTRRPRIQLPRTRLLRMRPPKPNRASVTRTETNVRMTAQQPAAQPGR